MNIEKLIQMAEKRISYLEGLKSSAELIGDVDAMIRAESEIIEVQQTILKLRAIPAS